MNIIFVFIKKIPISFTKKEKRTDLNLKIEELELHKRNLKKSELKSEYENINEYLNKKEKLEEELKVLLEELKDVQAICDLKKLNNLRDEFKNYEFLKESLKEKEDKKWKNSLNLRKIIRLLDKKL